MGERRHPGYQGLYPHPALGLDPRAARRRVMAHPEVMPPEPAPLRYRGMRERFGLRLRAGLLIAAAGFLGAVLAGRLIGGGLRGWRLVRPGRVGSQHPFALARFRNGRGGRRVLLLARR